MMKNKEYKNKIVIISVIVFLFIVSLIVIYLKKHISMKKVDNDIYYVKYDSTWKLKESTNNKIVFKNSNGVVTIQISEFDKKHKHSNISELFDEIIYNVKEQNPSYKLLSSKKDKITKNYYEGYKLLYENEDKQVMIWLYSDDNKFIVINYEASNKYFDVLLDSVNNIVYNFGLQEEKYDLASKLDLKLSKIEYGTNLEIDSKITDTKSYEVADNNYLVNFSVPSIFVLDSLNPSSPSFEFKLNENEANSTIKLNASILKHNIYEEIPSVYKMKYYCKDGDDDFKDCKESLDKLNSNYDSYIYKASYTYTKAIDWNSDSFEYKDRDSEIITLLYAINNNHTLIIKLESSEISITKKLIDSIKINDVNNYSSYIKIVKDGDYLVGELKTIIKDYSIFSKKRENKIEIITLKIPDRFEEIYKSYRLNPYEERNYGYNYDKKYLLYDYEVKYELDTFSLSDDRDKDHIDSYNSSWVKTTYGKANKLKYIGNMTLNDKKFNVYNGGYTNRSGILLTNTNRKYYYKNVTILSYELPSQHHLYITISGNGKEIGKELLKELTNFTILEKDF